MAHTVLPDRGSPSRGESFVSQFIVGESMFAESLIGRQLGGALLTDLVGRGGMGIVYRARDQDGDVVALKVMAPELAQDHDLRERFIREATVSINHPNVLPIYRAGVDEGHLFIITKLVNGPDLKAVIRSEGRIRPSRVVDIFHQAGAALDAAHENGIVHRDVKPQNFLLEQAAGSRDHVYLSDFGLVKNVAGSSLTASAHLVGSVHYMSPEQIRNRQIDGRSDVYSLGCVLYESITGQLPFDAREEVAVLFSHVNESPPSVTSRVATMPTAIDSVVAKAMAKDPTHRYLTAGDLAIDVAEVLSSEVPKRLWGPMNVRALPPPPTAERDSAATAPPRRAPSYGGWVAAALALAVAVLGFTDVIGPPTRRPVALVEAGGQTSDATDSSASDLAARESATQGKSRARGKDVTQGQRSREKDQATRRRTSDTTVDATGDPSSHSGVSERQKPPVVAIPQPAFGRYVYEQKGYEAVCPVDAGCFEGSNVWSTQQLTVSPTSSSRPRHYVTASRHSPRLLIQSHLVQTRASTRLVETLMTFNTTEGAFSVRLQPDPAADLVRFPFIGPHRWNGAWTSRPTSGRYSVDIEGMDTTKIGKREVKAMRVSTTMTWDGPHAGRLQSTSWVDPWTRLVVETVGVIEANTGEGDRFYKVTFQSTLRSGPGY